MRKVPIHPELIKIGLVAHRNQVAAKGERRLFPEWSSDKNGKYANRGAVRSFNRSLLPRVGAKTDTTAFHSFRHTFKDAARDAGIQREIHHGLTGHSLSTEGDKYGDGVSAERLAEEISKVTIQLIQATIRRIIHPATP